MNEAILLILAIGALLGGLDRLFGNRFGMGDQFEQGFLLLGPTALSMAGIICLTPLLTLLLKTVAAPLCTFLGLDPALLGSILAMDMGGYQLSMDLAATPAFGIYFGIFVAATFGCTLSFTLPVGMGMLAPESRPLFAKGLLIGLSLMPLSLIFAGLMQGISFLPLLLQLIPLLLLCALLMVGIAKWPKATIRCFTVLSALLKAAATIGLALGAASCLTGWEIPYLSPLEDAMKVVASIGIAMLGSLPLAALLRRVLKHPMIWVEERTGLNRASLTGLLMAGISVVPALALMEEMDSRGKVLNGAFMVCGASALAAHVGFTFGVQPQLTFALLLVKISGAIIGAAAAFFLTMGKKSSSSEGVKA